MFASLNEIVHYIKSYYFAVFNRAYFYIILGVLTGIVCTNYFLRVPVAHDNGMPYFIARYCLYFFPYAFAFLLQYRFFPHLTYYKSRWFWLLLVLAPLFFSLRVSFNLQQKFFEKTWLENISRYWQAIFKMLVRSLLLAVPVFIFWWMKDKKDQRPYGINPLKNSKVFFILFAFMIPLVVAAGFLPGFLRTYPVVLRVVDADLLSKKTASLIFELCYAFDFFSIEFFFRGFLILALIRTCGMQAIIPAAVFYCCIHLGKPMPEAISSFFGGLLLGIITYHNKSIWGGLIIHIGIAWLMEIVALFQHFT